MTTCRGASWPDPAMIWRSLIQKQSWFKTASRLSLKSKTSLGVAHYLFNTDRERLNAEDKWFAPGVSASDFTAAVVVVVVTDTHITVSRRRRQLTQTKHCDSFRALKLIRSQWSINQNLGINGCTELFYGIFLSHNAYIDSSINSWVWQGGKFSGS